MLSIDRVREWGAFDLVDQTGETIGSIEELYVDDTTGAPEFALVRFGLLRREGHLVPLAGAEETDGKIVVPVLKGSIEEAPGPDSERLSPEDERRVYEHYGLSAGAPDGRRSTPPPADLVEAEQADSTRLRRHDRVWSAGGEPLGSGDDRHGGG
jgi:hypothetical protein